MYHYDVEGRLIAESNQKGEVQKEYLWLDGELIAAAESGELYFAHRDYRNQPCLVTNKDGEVVWKAVSSPFGTAKVLSPSRPDFGKIAETPNQNTETIGGFTLNLRLPGQHFDAETGYHYNGFRDYSPELGRYLRADPIGLNGGMNLYAYCGGDPVNRKDERGLGFEDDDYQDSYGGWDNSGLDGMEDLDENDGVEGNQGSDHSQNNPITLTTTYRARLGFPPFELEFVLNPKTMKVTAGLNLMIGTPGASFVTRHSTNPNSKAGSVAGGVGSFYGGVATDGSYIEQGFGTPGIGWSNSMPEGMKTIGGLIEDTFDQLSDTESHTAYGGDWIIESFMDEDYQQDGGTSGGGDGW